ncbi:helix-turn-helix domain-containing protein [Serinicoccus kebangsaanensis]|uniref:helix-turn-helix domain-containing protein n=1 Tax=Serinicoccus kebangsaanensis TaxID=2602069 RepID=UPI00124DA1AE|nr:helix-turn-helix transcriptional regulator [Serinicoccus kebangsaanensis]
MSTVVPLHRRHRRRLPELLWREAVGEVLREERQDRGERIVDTAGTAGVSPQYLSEVERGRKDPSSEVLSALTGALDLSVAEVAARAADRMTRSSGPLCLAA